MDLEIGTFSSVDDLSMFLLFLLILDMLAGEMTPDIVSYNTAIKACGNAQQVDLAFKVRDCGVEGL